MWFINYSSAFNTIGPSKLVIKLETLGLDPALCNWVLDNISTLLILNTGAPQGCVLSPLLYSLFTHDCVAMHASNSIIKFADDTTVVGLITNNDETAYREEETAEGAHPYPHRRNCSGVPRHTHHGQTNGQCGEEGATSPLQPQEAKEIWLVTKNTQTFTDAQSRASCRAVSPPGTATAPPTTVRLSRG
ncbi:unnamed protein product [Oncorhynchus mykiss]|uniref:Reverse transcriptase domain-containing protein n=1 Tax=Oncorhynchus mykiss TaxID=8022 RepID=A0A060VVU0_ONCMY|nr:unnamed protein product [Oncorhynchus mykiss]